MRIIDAPDLSSASHSLGDTRSENEPLHCWPHWRAAAGFALVPNKAKTTITAQPTNQKCFRACSFLSSLSESIRSSSSERAQVALNAFRYASLYLCVSNQSNPKSKVFHSAQIRLERRRLIGERRFILSDANDSGIGFLSSLGRFDRWTGSGGRRDHRLDRRFRSDRRRECKVGEHRRCNR